MGQRLRNHKLELGSVLRCRFKSKTAKICPSEEDMAKLLRYLVMDSRNTSNHHQIIVKKNRVEVVSIF